MFADYDACEEDKPCEHTCENKDGREFVCSCNNGFELAADRTSCIGNKLNLFIPTSYLWQFKP